MEEKKLTGYASIDKPWLKYYSEEAITSEIPEQSVYAYLFECNKKRMELPAIDYFGKIYTYADLFEHIDQVANALLQLGVRQGDIVSVTAPMLPEVIFLFYALNKIGAISNFVDPRSKESVIKHYLCEVSSRFLFLLDSCYDSVVNILNETKIEKTIVFSAKNSLPTVAKLLYGLKNKSINKVIRTNECFMLWKEFVNLNRGNKSLPNVQYEKNGTITIAHTGGTTGVPKGVQLTNYNYNALVHQYSVSGIPLNEGESWLGVIPPFVAYGSGTGMHLPLARGMKLILVPQFGANNFDDVIIKYKANHMAIVPSYFKSVVNSEKLKNADLSYLIAPVVGGDAMEPSFEDEINSFLHSHGCKYKISKGYGMTEGSSGVSVTVCPECNRIGCVGIPLVNTVISVFEPGTDQELRISEKGEVCICTPTMMTGYFNKPDETSNILKKHSDGNIWIHSGDVGYLTEDGVLYIEGRIKRMIIDHDGFKIFPAAIESLIMHHAAISGCSVVGVPDRVNKKGSVPVVFVTLKEKSGNDWAKVKKEICALCADNLQDYEQPVDYILKDKLPVTNIGKIDYRALEKEASNL